VTLMILGLRNMASYVKTKATLAHRTLPHPGCRIDFTR
jgi:hypothetical protein